MKTSSVVPILVLLLAAPAFGGTIEEMRTSLGWQAQYAEVVVTGQVMSAQVLEEKIEEKAVTIRVVSKLSGPDTLPGTLEIEWIGDLRVAVGSIGLFFLDGRNRPLAGSFSAVPSPTDGVTGYVKTRLASLEEGSKGKDLREEVLVGIESADAVVALSAALDFGWIEGIEAGITDAEVDRVIAVFTTARRADRRKRALAVALGVTGSPRAIAPLALAVISGKARAYRAEVGDAIARVGSESAVKELTEGLKSDAATTRADVVNVLGRSGLADAATVVVKALADPAGVVRTEAALATGELARTYRSRKKDAPKAHEALATVYGEATDVREKKAALWAAAQLDTQAGYDVVRKAAAEATDRAVREFAEKVLKNPRRRLVL